MHSERFVLSEKTAKAIAAAQRVIAVGTTVTRVLEHLAREAAGGELRAARGETDIFIYPPYEFRAIGGLLTNFHLPKSTLLMLVSAFAGCDLVLEAYAQAVREKYRFFSYGDCMLLL
jgi:S-adenosylmethionine:tRNA ribosyltransferase-isomerase